MNSSVTYDKDTADGVLSALKYYSLFSYPLRIEELHGSMPVPVSLNALLPVLADMVLNGVAYQYQGYYGLQANMAEIVNKRREANDRAREEVKKAIKVGRFIFRFPFVRCVGISGSLSKGVATEKSDFDFFIITEENRLWICRTLLHCFKKLTFIFGQQDKFCMNYFIDAASLEIQDKNRFTAVELESLILVSGKEVHKQFKAGNAWVWDLLPNGYKGFAVNHVPDDRGGFLKKAAEFLCNAFFPRQMNKALMVATDKKWRRKWQRRNYPMNDYDVAFRTSLHVSKNHPANHQKRVLDVLATIEKYTH